MIVNDRITAYIQSLDAGNGPLLDSIEEEALADCVPIIRRETSAFLKTLIALKRPQSILEVGTAVGYSALLMSRVMPENCRITTIEKYEKRIPIAKRNFERAGKEPCITLLEGDAEEMRAEHAAGEAREKLEKCVGGLPIREGEAMIREVHVYGMATQLGADGTSAQHLGLGRRLVERACAIAREAGYGHVNVISAVGTREYYRHLGFCDHGLYQRKELL